MKNIKGKPLSLDPKQILNKYNFLLELINNSKRIKKIANKNEN